MLRVSRDQICSLLGKGNLVEHYILGVGKDFFGLGPFQREALLKNHIQYSINQLGREMELGPGKDISVFIENLRIVERDNGAVHNLVPDNDGCRSD